MDSTIVFLSRLLFVLLFCSALNRVASAELILEDGYTVSTVLNGYKSNVEVTPHSVLPQSTPSDLFVLLDSVASSFYTVSMHENPNQVKIERLAGNGGPGYTDGDLTSAKFDKPTSFAVDFNGNIYVADQRNHVIRKITKSGVTTIAGGNSRKTGNADGPAQNASFSNKFMLAFTPERCALMIADEGNNLIRQIKLKAADCKPATATGSVLGTTCYWILALVLSCIIGIVVGFVTRPYIIQCEGINPQRPSWTWTYCLMNLERQIVMLCSVIINAVVKSTVYSFLRQVMVLNLSCLSLMFRPARAGPCPTYEKPVSLLDLDDICNSNSSSSAMNNSMVIPREVDNQLKHLLDFDGGLMLPVSSYQAVEQEQVKENTGASSAEHENIDDMILANLMKFEEQVPVTSREPLECSSGLVKRR